MQPRFQPHAIGMTVALQQSSNRHQKEATQDLEERVMKTKLLALFLLAGSSLFAGPRVFFGFGVGVGPSYGGYYVAAPPPAPVFSYAPAPYVAAPGYSWIGGYWYPSGPCWHWRAGYWARRPYVGASWVTPRYYGHRYYPGYWRR